MLKVKRNLLSDNFLGAFVLSIASLFSFSSQAAENWEFQINPYVFATNIDGDASAGRLTGVEVSLDTGDILERLDAAAMIHFEAWHKSNWGFFVDYSFMDLSDDIDGPRGGIVSARVRQGVLAAYLGKRYQYGVNTIEYVLGARWWENRLEATVDTRLLPGSPGANVKEEWIDLLLGVRWTKPLNDKWRVFGMVDVGVTEADFTSLLELTFYYQINQDWEVGLKYRGIWVDFEEGVNATPGYFQYDTVTHGPIIEFAFHF